MNELLATLSPTQRKLITSVVVVALVFLVRWIILRAVHRRIDSAEVWFRTRKWLSYATFVVVVLALINVWLGGLGGAATYLGIVSAGIAIALADVLKNLAGWVFLMTRRPFRIGDRIEIQGKVGDVVDIRVFRFTLLEIGNWVAADQSTGRLIHVPNGLVFTETVANYSEGFPFIWDEIGVLITFESDWRRCEAVLREALAAHAPDVHARRVREQLREAAQEYFIKYAHIEPTVYLSVLDSGVILTGRYLVGVRERRGVKEALWKAILDAFAADPALDLAYPTTRTVFPDALRIRMESPGSPVEPDPERDETGGSG